MMCGGLLAFSVAMLGSLQVADQSARNPGGYLMDFKIVASGDRGEFAEKDVLFVRNLDQWQKLRTKLGIPDEKDIEARGTHGALGGIDWGREQVVFARSPQQRTGGYSLKVQRLTRFTNSWRIDLTLQAPPKDVLTTDALTTPYVVFRCRRTTSDPTLVVHFAIRE